MKYVSLILLFSICAIAGEDPKKAAFINKCVDDVQRLSIETGRVSEQAAHNWSQDLCYDEWNLADFHNEIKDMKYPEFEGCKRGLSAFFRPSDSIEFRKHAFLKYCIQNQ